MTQVGAGALWNYGRALGIHLQKGPVHADRNRESAPHGTGRIHRAFFFNTTHSSSIVMIREPSGRECTDEHSSSDGSGPGQHGGLDINDRHMWVYAKARVGLAPSPGPRATSDVESGLAIGCVCNCSDACR